jgi:hypothetical protein
VRQIAAAEHTDPAGRRVRVSRDTLDRWPRAWRRGGFDALVPDPRQSAPASGRGDRDQRRGDMTCRGAARPLSVSLFVRSARAPVAVTCLLPRRRGPRVRGGLGRAGQNGVAFGGGPLDVLRRREASTSAAAAEARSSPASSMRDTAKSRPSEQAHSPSTLTPLFYVEAQELISLVHRSLYTFPKTPPSLLRQERFDSASSIAYGPIFLHRQKCRMTNGMN